MAIETIEYNGKTYRRNPESKHRTSRVYFRGCHKYLHRQIWEDNYGEIPKGCHIHHKNDDPGDNSLSNLVCISPSEHGKAHFGDERRKSMGKAWKKFGAWHSTPEGVAHHKKMGEITKATWNNLKPIQKQCEHCKETFFDKKIGNPKRFCSGRCALAHRRASGVTKETRVCAHCGNAFIADKYKKSATCSGSCRNHHFRWAKRDADPCLKQPTKLS